MGVAGMVMSSGYDALWYPVCYACGYLFLLLFIAGPLRRFGAYTIPDFAEGRFDSPVFRKIAVIFVLFIGFFYTMPQMKGAGTTLAYIFPGLPYWAGVVLVGAVITLNVALGGMKGITLVQAFQYWAKMFAISVPIFVLMAVYGSYGKQLKVVDPYVEDSGFSQVKRQPLPAKAPQDQTWLSPFGPLTTKAAKAAAAALTNTPAEAISLRSDLSPDTKMTVNMSDTNIARALGLYAQLTGRTLLPRTNGLVGRIDTFFGGRLSRWGWVTIPPYPSAGIFVHGDGLFSAGQVKGHLEGIFRTNGVIVVPQGESGFRAITGVAGDSGIARQKAWLAQHEKPLALLYTYSLIIALVCGTAGLPHILVRFYTNPDGVAAKRTTMWVMILIGVFYLFPPVFGVMGRNLMPDLYNGLSGVKGTDGVVLRLPTILHEKYGVLGSILSGITCAGAFAAFMSTFSGLLVSMTGALAHDVYGRMLNPQSTPHQRLRAFKIFAVAVGGVAILLGTQVEQLQINFMVGQAFAIAAASYFPLLFMSTWWRGMTARGAATGMLTGGVCALAAVTLTNFSDLKWLPLDGFWKSQPLLRILCEQPAIWTVPLAIGLMIIVSRVTRGEVPTDVRMKMLVLHAPEQLGLKQEYIQEHQQGH
jgi:Na+(H+)/acetate symporter ActP